MARINNGVRTAGISVASGALLITAVTLVSRALGLGRSAVQASTVGSTGIGEIYAAANILPNILFEVVAGGALAGAVVPLITAAIARRSQLGVNRNASALLSWTLVVLIPLAAVVALLAPAIIAVIPRVNSPEFSGIGVSMLRIFAIQIPLYGISVVAAGVLQAHRRFFWPAAAPILSTVTIVIPFYIFGNLAAGNQGNPELLSAEALNWLSWGSTAAVVALSFPLLVPVHRLGVRFYPTLKFTDGQGARARSLAIAGIGALIAQQVSVFVVLMVANGAGEGGAYPVYQYAQAVYVLPYAILAVPLTTSAFPKLAEYATLGSRQAFSTLAATSTRAIIIVSAAGAAVLTAAAKPIEAFFGFTTGGVAHMSTIIAWSAPGLIGFALMLHAARILYAVDRPRSAVIAVSAGWATVSLVALTSWWAFLPSADTPAAFRALGLANSAGMTLGGILLLVAVRRHVGRQALHRVLHTAGIVIGVSAVGATLLHMVAEKLTPTGTSVLHGALVALAVGAVTLVVVMVAGYCADPAAVQGLRHGDGSLPQPAPQNVSNAAPTKSDSEPGSDPHPHTR